MSRSAGSVRHGRSCECMRGTAAQHVAHFHLTQGAGYLSSGKPLLTEQLFHPVPSNLSVRRVVRSSARALPGVSHVKLQALRTLRFVAFAKEGDPSGRFGTAGALPSLAKKRQPAADTTPASRSWLVSVTRFPPTAWVRPQDDHTTPLFRLHKFPTAGGSRSPPARLVSATHRSRTIGTPRIRGRTDTSARTDPRLGTKRQRHGPHDHPFPASLRYQSQTRTPAQSRRAVCLVRTNRTRDSA